MEAGWISINPVMWVSTSLVVT